jgi:adenylate kinase family enzyme
LDEIKVEAGLGGRIIQFCPKKIHIIGSVGSGKTTLARNLSNKLSIPYYELDNVVWKRHKPRDIKRTNEERDQLLSTIVHSNTWIIEDAHYNEWVFQSFNNADLIVFLDTENFKRKYRIKLNSNNEGLNITMRQATPVVSEGQWRLFSP